MTSINIGPLAFPVAPLLLLAGWTLASWFGKWLAPLSLKAAVASAINQATIIGLVVSRGVHVLINASAYADAPRSSIDFRDGGWQPMAGVAAGVAWLLWRAVRLPRGSVQPAQAVDLVHPKPWRLALAGGAALGLVTWLGAAILLAAPAGLPMPAVTLTRLDTEQPSTAAQLAAGRPMVVNLWATWCAPCRAEMPALAQAQREMPDVMFVFANQGEAAVPAKRYLSTMNIPFDSVLLDPAWALGAAVGSRSLPTTLFVDARGVIRKTHVGVLNRAALQVEVDALRAVR